MAITIPDTFASNAALVDAYRRGWNHGHGIACHNVPTLGNKVCSDSLGRVTVDAENIREVHQDACYEAATNARCYSPFEFTANEFNAAPEGGYRVEACDGETWDVCDTREEAEAMARDEGLEEGEYEIEELESSEDLWNAFEEGTTDAIQADLATYSDDDYGIEEEENENA